MACRATRGRGLQDRKGQIPGAGSPCPLFQGIGGIGKGGATVQAEHHPVAHRQGRETGNAQRNQIAGKIRRRLQLDGFQRP